MSKDLSRRDFFSKRNQRGRRVWGPSVVSPTRSVFWAPTIGCASPSAAFTAAETIIWRTTPRSTTWRSRRSATSTRASSPSDCRRWRRWGWPKPATYTDIRKLLEDKSIDAISIATPNHWHSLMAIWACQAGKDVYVEKPCSHNIFEGRQMVTAAQKYNRIVQHGTQMPSDRGCTRGGSAR